MPGQMSSAHERSRLRRQAMLLLYPQLRAFPMDAWESVLARARHSDFDVQEWIGIVGGVCLVAWLLGQGVVPVDMASRFLGYLLQFVLALPLLIVVVGPFYVRRTRRGLERERSRQQRHASEVKSSFEGKESRHGCPVDDG